jgi:hypothetical protein
MGRTRTRRPKPQKTVTQRQHRDDRAAVRGAPKTYMTLRGLLQAWNRGALTTVLRGGAPTVRLVGSPNVGQTVVVNVGGHDLLTIDLKDFAREAAQALGFRGARQLTWPVGVRRRRQHPPRTWLPARGHGDQPGD